MYCREPLSRSDSPYSKLPTTSEASFRCRYHIANKMFHFQIINEVTQFDWRYLPYRNSRRRVEWEGKHVGKGSSYWVRNIGKERSDDELFFSEKEWVGISIHTIQFSVCISDLFVRRWNVQHISLIYVENIRYCSHKMYA